MPCKFTLEKIISNRWHTTVLLALLLVLSPLPQSVRAQLIDRVLTTVDNRVILLSEFNEEYKRVISQLKQQHGDNLPAEHSLKQQILDRMILNSLQLQLAERAGVIISDEELTRAAGQIASRNNRTLHMFRIDLEKSGDSWEAYRERLRNEIIVHRVQRNFMRQLVEVTDQEIDNFLASDEGQDLKLKAEYHLLHVRVPLKEKASNLEIETAQACLTELRRRIAAGEKFMDQQDLGKNCQPRFTDLGWRNLTEIPSLFERQVPRMRIGEISRDIRNPSALHAIQLVEQRGGGIKLIEKWQVRHILIIPSIVKTVADIVEQLYEIRDRIVTGEVVFADMAQIYSEDPGSKHEGGELGWVEPGQMDPVFEQQITSTELDTISEPFETSFGWHILEVTDHRTQDVGQEELRDQAFSVLFNRKYEAELLLWLQQLRDEALVDTRW